MKIIFVILRFVSRIPFMYLLIIEPLIINTKLRTHKIQVKNLSQILDLSDSTERKIAMGTFEVFERTILKKIVSPGDLVIDVGAHIGYHSVNLAELVGEFGKLICFEPVFENFSKLQKNMSNLKLDNYLLFNKAAAISSGQVTLGNDQNFGNSGAFSILNGYNTITVECIDFNDFLSKLKKIDLIKIDIEGYEFELFSSLSKDNLKKIKMVLFEVVIEPSNKMNIDKLVSFFENNDFKVYRPLNSRFKLKTLSYLETYKILKILLKIYSFLTNKKSATTCNFFAKNLKGNGINFIS